MRVKNTTGVVADTEFTNEDGTPIHGVCSLKINFKDNKSLVTAEADLELVEVNVSDVGRVTYFMRHPIYGHREEIEFVRFRGPSHDLRSDVVPK